MEYFRLFPYNEHLSRKCNAKCPTRLEECGRSRVSGAVVFVRHSQAGSRRPRPCMPGPRDMSRQYKQEQLFSNYNVKLDVIAKDKEKRAKGIKFKQRANLATRMKCCNMKEMLQHIAQLNASLFTSPLCYSCVKGIGKRLVRERTSTQGRGNNQPQWRAVAIWAIRTGRS